MKRRRIFRHDEDDGAEFSCSHCDGRNNYIKQGRVGGGPGEVKYRRLPKKLVWDGERVKTRYVQKEEQEEISRNHVPRLFLGSVFREKRGDNENALFGRLQYRGTNSDLRWKTCVWKVDEIGLKP